MGLHFTCHRAGIRYTLVIGLAVALSACSALGSIGSPETATDASTVGNISDEIVEDGLVPTATTAFVGEPTTASLTAGDTADLEQAIRSSADVNGPYGYVSLEPLCIDCPPDAIVQLYLVPSTDDPETRQPEQAWANGEEIGFEGAAWGIDPVDVPQLLLEAIGAGSDVGWTIHPGTFLVDSWTIDGVGARYFCYQVDTASLDLRDRDCYGGMLGRG